MTEFQEEGDLYLWGFRFRGDADAENEAELFGKNHALSREENRRRYEMDWLLRHGTVKEVRACADWIRGIELDQLVEAAKWVRKRMVPDGL